MGVDRPIVSPNTAVIPETFVLILALYVRSGIRDRRAVCVFIRIYQTSWRDSGRESGSAQNRTGQNEKYQFVVTGSMRLCGKDDHRLKQLLKVHGSQAGILVAPCSVIVTPSRSKMVREKTTTLESQYSPGR